MDGERYQVEVPATLDLADRAALAINGLTGVLDAEHGYEMYFIVRFCTNPAHMYHDTTGWPTNNPKFAESLPMMRVMSGSEQAVDAEAGMMRSMMDAIGDDGLFYALSSAQRPWHEGVGHVYRTPEGEIIRKDEDFANVYGVSRMALALMAWWQTDGSEKWRTAAHDMVHGLIDITIDRGDYAYYPDAEMGEAFSRPRSGWPNATEPVQERMGAEGSMFMYHCGPIRAMARWYILTGDERALESARKLVNFVMRPQFWGAPTGEDGNITGMDRANFVGHHHGHVALLRGLLDYAIATNDAGIMEFVRNGYEFARNRQIPRIGLFGEGCSTADMIACAVRLCDANVGDYWEDVDQYTRNQLVEYQLTDADLLRRVAEGSASHEVDEPQQTIDQVIERNLGNFAGNYGNPTSLTDTWIMQCCTGNASQALYYAWEGALRFDSGVAQVNLLMNRASPWLDVDSHLPYEGKVVIRNKTAQKVAVRVPRWVDRSAIVCHQNADEVSPYWVGSSHVFDQVRANDKLTLEFPVVDAVEKYTHGGTEYTCTFRGNTLVDITPRDEALGYPIFVRDHMKADKAPTRLATRFVSPVVINW